MLLSKNALTHLHLHPKGMHLEAHRHHRCNCSTSLLDLLAKFIQNGYLFIILTFKTLVHDQNTEISPFKVWPPGSRQPDIHTKCSHRIGSYNAQARRGNAMVET
ncbi:hypothetical protein Zmor_015394 [Zophobas morio]|uniref:Uncharacterized protein n=1 Tax=Zophobas morio TaxID=2755281 RepID=A0AA38IE38_9CUCU|nr:hypothetical protein Zmor_015394 [Zophobas morio]